MSGVVRVLPPRFTAETVALGAALTVGMFPIIVCAFLALVVVAYAALAGLRSGELSTASGLLFTLVGLPLALLVSVAVTAVATIFPGTGLSVLASWLLRGRSSVKEHLIAQTTAGVLTGSTVVLVFLCATQTDLLTNGRLFLVIIVGIVVLSGLSSAFGWFTSVRLAAWSPRSTLSNPHNVTIQEAHA